MRIRISRAWAWPGAAAGGFFAAAEACDCCARTGMAAARSRVAAHSIIDASSRVSCVGFMAIPPFQGTLLDGSTRGSSRARDRRWFVESAAQREVQVDALRELLTPHMQTRGACSVQREPPLLDRMHVHRPDAILGQSDF